MCYFIAPVYTTFITSLISPSSLKNLKNQEFKNHLSHYFAHQPLLNTIIRITVCIYSILKFAETFHVHKFSAKNNSRERQVQGGGEFAQCNGVT